MSSLKNILNPERKRSVKLVVVPPEPGPATWDVPSSPGSSSEDDPGPYNLHIPHPDCPDSLACLPDTDGRPQHTLPVILRCAILGAPRKRLTIREIYAAMEEKYAYYRTAGQTWKQSVRHHLSLNRLFERQPRPATDPGFGSYWTVNLAAPPGTKRPRKRGRPNKDAQAKKNDTVEEGGSKPRRGRPRKEDTPPPIDVAVAEPPLPIEPSVQVDDDEEVDMLIYEDRDELVDELDHVSELEEDCESEERPLVLHPFERRSSLPSLTQYDSSGGFHIHSPEPPEPLIIDTDDIIERLQMEMASLRRQSAEASSQSLYLSDQLARAQSDTSAAQAALAAAEMKLRDETNKRRQAERVAEEAIKLRHAAEEALESVRYHSDLSRQTR
ncbi:hypothetical protein DFH07DRAFT_826548 [Mycena maculata]|uniref:Fork-head domain-containing protein n=1 Tax=Mycena maculata TaxID=230809 RepID=A0AAD7NA81_9AGAR|nr:hypothetical protein DFH07DRAFT_826548 [Mycena maculata]